VIDQPRARAAIAYADTLGVAQVVLGVVGVEDLMATTLTRHARTLPARSRSTKKPAFRALTFGTMVRE
jgi:hypothetical protein